MMLKNETSFSVCRLDEYVCCFAHFCVSSCALIEAEQPIRVVSLTAASVPDSTEQC